MVACKSNELGGRLRPRDRSKNALCFLDNSGKSNSLRWDWKLGSKVYGVLSASEDEAIAGFNETRSTYENTHVSQLKIVTPINAPIKTHTYQSINEIGDIKW